jgi:hypothetical protein
MRWFGLWVMAAGVWAGGAARGQDATPADGRELLGLLVSGTPANPGSANLFWSAAPDATRAAAAGGVVSLGAHPLTAGWAQLVLGQKPPAAGDTDLPLDVGMTGGRASSFAGGGFAGGAGGGPAPAAGGGSGGGGGGGGGGGSRGGGGAKAARADGLPLLSAATPALMDAASVPAGPGSPVVSLTATDGGAVETPDVGSLPPGADKGGPSAGLADGTGVVPGDPPVGEPGPGGGPGGPGSVVGTPEPGTLLLAALGAAAVLARRRRANPER